MSADRKPSPMPGAPTGGRAGEPAIGIASGLATGPRIGERSVGLFVGAIFALSPIGLAIFSVDVLVFGVPVLALYLFGLWALIIALLAGLARLGEAQEDEAATSQGDQPIPDVPPERQG